MAKPSAPALKTSEWKTAHD
jgi:hypothetical protein